MPHRPAVTRTLALTAFMSSAALAEDNILDPISGALDGANNVMMTVDSTIAMLAKAIDLLTMVPVIGPFAQMLKPIVNTYMDIKTTIMPIIDAGNRGMAYVKQINEARNTVRQMFSNSNFSDRVNSINSLVGQFGGLSSLSGNARTIDPNDPRGSVARILSSADQQIADVRSQISQAQSQRDMPRYRALVQREEELKGLRTRIRQAGEMAASQRDSMKLVTRTSQVAADAARRAPGQAANLQATLSAEGALKILGTMAIEQLNVNAGGFDALSQQLATISQNQTITNEQNDQLLSHFQQQERERTARNRQLIEETTRRQEEEYKSMVKRTDLLADSIGQTLRPSDERRSDIRSLMGGSK
ncbi:hypothetical protein J2Y00_003622 [Deinococcus soli (ex Cha et al. 2016)]|uniref:Uncharacterized protein n=1 Tax=Deinococcus soli (ex Cha et al. 2016) TaxID=1309411 RepID=A0AAE4BPQ7_9DEIO|nr:hypothetical protein [Deinococcus soli (ex Cha et al. 2016)]MDR6220011.1 hypothetical protein [Deinococcus soli (ex Cha et al. 2016)]GGB61191.1 hypothetical protein GCM10008019_16460 [Deinococcus soli (ex Cha et al. 2016)]